MEYAHWPTISFLQNEIVTYDSGCSHKIESIFNLSELIYTHELKNHI